MSKKLVIDILEEQEHHWLDVLASESWPDILKTANSELNRVRKALKYMREKHK